MAIKKIQQPLLYIQQPSLEKLNAPMQQSFMIRNPRKSLNLTQEAETKINNAVENTDEPKVMEFILEGILSPELERIIEDKPNLVEIPSSLAQNEEIAFDDTIDLIMNKKAKDEQKTIEEDTVNLRHESNLPLEKNENKKVGKRLHFNQMSIENKLIQLRRMPSDVVKIVYEFVTKEITYRGYYLSSKEGTYIIQPNKNSQSIEIFEKDLIDINIIGF